MTNDLVRVENLKSCKRLANVTGLEHLLARHGDGSLFRFGVFDNLLEVNLLEVEDDVGYIFLDTGHGVKLMLNAIDANRGNGKTLERGEENATERITYSYAISGLQWLELELTEEIIGLQHDDLVRFLKC